jgi:hypothetical protein
MPPYKQGGAFQRWAAISHRLRSPFCSDNGELPLPKPLRSAILTRNRRISGECLFNRLSEIFSNFFMTDQDSPAGAE